MKYSKISESLYIKGRIGWKGLKKKEYLKEGSYRIINGSNIVDNKIDWSNCGYISKERYDESEEIKLKEGDILITKDGTIGKVAMVNKLDKPSTVASGLFILRNINLKKWDTLYLFYYLQSFKFKEFIHSRTSGSVIPHLYQRDFEELMIPELSLKKQKQISQKLHSIQQKIDLNNKINSNLLEFVTLIWKKYNSNTVNGVTLKKLANTIVTGKTPSTKIKENYGNDIPFVKIPDMHNKVFIDETSQSLTLQGANSQKNKYIPANSILVSCIGTPGLVSITDKNVQTNQQINSLILDEKYLYCTFIELRSNKDMIGNLGSGGTTIKNLNKTDFSNIVINIPNTDKLLEKFNSVARPIFNNIHENMIQTQKLKKIKATLLSEYF